VATLPFTGSGSGPAVFGISFLTAGGILALRRRRRWVTPPLARSRH
jgi:LPXTG-motif cell wall-anchored protein